jgi:hypothetical protein
MPADVPSDNSLLGRLNINLPMLTPAALNSIIEKHTNQLKKAHSANSLNSLSDLSPNSVHTNHSSGSTTVASTYRQVSADYLNINPPYNLANNNNNSNNPVSTATQSTLQVLEMSDISGSIVTLPLSVVPSAASITALFDDLANTKLQKSQSDNNTHASFVDSENPSNISRSVGEDSAAAALPNKVKLKPLITSGSASPDKTTRSLSTKAKKKGLASKRNTSSKSVTQSPMNINKAAILSKSGANLPTSLPSTATNASSKLNLLRNERKPALRFADSSETLHFAESSVNKSRLKSYSAQVSLSNSFDSVAAIYRGSDGLAHSKLNANPKLQRVLSGGAHSNSSSLLLQPVAVTRSASDQTTIKQMLQLTRNHSTHSFINSSNNNSNIGAPTTNGNLARSHVLHHPSSHGASTSSSSNNNNGKQFSSVPLYPRNIGMGYTQPPSLLQSSSVIIDDVALTRPSYPVRARSFGSNSSYSNHSNSSTLSGNDLPRLTVQVYSPHSTPPRSYHPLPSSGSYPVISGKKERNAGESKSGNSSNNSTNTFTSPKNADNSTPKYAESNPTAELNYNYAPIVQSSASITSTPNFPPMDSPIVVGNNILFSSSLFELGSHYDDATILYPIGYRVAAEEEDLIHSAALHRESSGQFKTL